MEQLFIEYIICVIEAIMTMVFCLYVICDHLQKRLSLLIVIVIVLAILGSAASMGLAAVLDTKLSFSIDFSMLSLPFWFAAAFFLLRWASGEMASNLLLIILLSVQTLHLCRSVTYFIYALFFPALIDDYFHWADIVGFGIPSIIITLLLAVCCRVLYQRLRRLNRQEYRRLWGIPMLFILLYLMQINLYPVNQVYSIAYGFKILLNVCAFVTYSQTTWAISSSAMAATETQKRLQIANQLELQRVRVEDMENHMKEMKHIRHDRRQHVRVLRGLLERGEVQEALTYLKDYEVSILKTNQQSLCDNVVVDTLCRRYEALAKQAGIEVSIRITLPKEPGVAGSDLAVILGNLWENAIAGALDAEDGQRFIHLCVTVKEKQIFIRMENNYSGVIYQEGEQFLSSKPNRNKREGVGIASIKEVSASYGGMADFTYTRDTFTASILLYANR